MDDDFKSMVDLEITKEKKLSTNKKKFKSKFPIYKKYKWPIACNNSYEMPTIEEDNQIDVDLDKQREE